MGLGKQAKILTRPQTEAVYGYLASTRHPERNRLIFLLSLKAGLRAKEIAGLKWSMVTDVEGNLSDDIRLTDNAAKGRSGRVIPINKELRSAFSIWKEVAEKEGRSSPFVIVTERARNTSSFAVVNLFAGWYRALGFAGASSHSGRRTFITNAARRISSVGGSLREVQILSGHSSLSTTQRYIEVNENALRRVVDLI
ncbi:integrase/recombinase XerD [Bosea sp. BE271]|uniref:tyrosine-type recombinase/integrase n=1 Tax=Bosea TaxID=85413 RepID=UPI00285F5131|nr:MULTISPECIES: site-specific integrase [Bosea]MDR6830838.1 integrase/recombinase XerD [Bosea robiniae]MDR6897622.1 integrase/recombinase XerD [Bosea sp. BE109]MDR7141019.1 integrase/recombinase XerD [Bosea sp. BE168]MDR7177671.1 integrase/recombinase XerD [Bosea sp. BE271]